MRLLNGLVYWLLHQLGLLEHWLVVYFLLLLDWEILDDLWHGFS
jgi:hypothetical protein